MRKVLVTRFLIKLHSDEYFITCNSNISQRLIIAWATQRVTYLDKLQRYEDSYAVSQEFCEWTTSLNVYSEGLKTATLKVSTFIQENRTG